MASTVYWIDEPFIMSADYEGRVTIDDYEKAMSICLDALKRQPVYFLVDLSKVTTFPLMVTMISPLIELSHHSNTMMLAFIGANRFAKLSIPTMVRRPYRFFDNRDRALEFVRQLVRTERAAQPTA